MNGTKAQASMASRIQISVWKPTPTSCTLKSFLKTRAYEALQSHQTIIKATRENDAYICANKTCKSEHTTAALEHVPSSESVGDVNQACKCPPRSTTPELCFMLAPPAPPAPVASSKPPSPFGPAHNQTGRCQLVMTTLTALQAWIASGTGITRPCVDLVVDKLHPCSVRRVSSAISACYASDPAFLTCKGRDQLL